MKEKITKLFKTGFFHIFGSSVINRIISLMSTIVLVRILSKSEYGVFTYAWNIYSIIILFSGMGMDSGCLQLMSEHSGDLQYADRVTNYGTSFGIKFNLLLAALLLGIGVFAPLTINGAREILCFLCLFPIIQFLSNMVNTYLRAQKRNKEYANLQIINTGVVFAASAGFAFLLREIGMAVGYYAAFTTTFLVGTLVYHVHLTHRDKTGIGSDRQALIKIAFISMVNNSLSQLMYLIDIFVLGIVDPQETILASYTVATMIPTALSFIPQTLVVYLYPYFAEHKDDGKWCLRRYKQILKYMGLLNMGISGILVVAAPLIIRIVFGAQYLDSVKIFRMLSLNYFVSGTFRTIAGNLLVTQRKLKFNLFVALISSATNIVADYFFIQWWGSEGAALATILVVAISSVFNVTYLLRTFHQKANA